MPNLEAVVSPCAYGAKHVAADAIKVSRACEPPLSLSLFLALSFFSCSFFSIYMYLSLSRYLAPSFFSCSLSLSLSVDISLSMPASLRQLPEGLSVSSNPFGAQAQYIILSPLGKGCADCCSQLPHAFRALLLDFIARPASVCGDACRAKCLGYAWPQRSRGAEDHNHWRFPW